MPGGSGDGPGRDRRPSGPTDRDPVAVGAVVAGVTGLVALFGGLLVLGLLASGLAWVLGLRGMRAEKAGSAGGPRLARTGLILGVVGVALAGLVIAVLALSPNR